MINEMITFCGRRPTVYAPLTKSLEEQPQPDLSDTGIQSRLKSAKVSFRTKVGEVTRGCAFVGVHLVKDIEELSPELNLESLGDREVLGQGHIPIIESWKTQATFADTAERARGVAGE